MREFISFLLSFLLLFLGIPIGNILAKATKEELIIGKKWFKRLILLSLFSSFISLLFKRDDLMFTFLFIAVVTSRSLIFEKKINKKVKKNLIKK